MVVLGVVVLFVLEMLLFYSIRWWKRNNDRIFDFSPGLLAWVCETCVTMVVSERMPESRRIGAWLALRFRVQKKRKTQCTVGTTVEYLR